MRILILLISMTALLVDAAEMDAPQKVMVQAVFKENARELASPRLIVLDGKEAQIEIKREIAVPGREQPLDAGIVLTIRPFVEEDCVRFSGFLQVRTEVACKPERKTDLHVVGFQTREAFFKGTAESEEFIRFTLDGMKISLKFAVVGRSTARD